MNNTNLIAHYLDSIKADSFERPTNNLFVQAVENMSKNYFELREDEFGSRKGRMRELRMKPNITEDKFSLHPSLL